MLDVDRDDDDVSSDDTNEALLNIMSKLREVLSWQGREMESAGEFREKKSHFSYIASVQNQHCCRSAKTS